jgi:aspartate/methionine/tyrosine aminotransferase
MTVVAHSRRALELPRSGVREVMELALRTPGAVRLDVGDPDFHTPGHIVDAAARAAQAGFTHYTPSVGLEPLRTLIAAKVTGRYGVLCSAADVVVSTGASGAIHASMLTVLDPGDEVLIPDPGWPNYVPMAASAGAVPVGYTLDRASGFGLDLDSIEARIDRRTRAIVVNSPGNPTGAVFTREALAAVQELARRHGLWLISDECYDELTFDRDHVSALEDGDRDMTIAVFSFSKTYAMTGWRIGYAVTTPETAALLARAQEAIVSCVSTISQKAAEAALAGPQAAVAEMREAYRRRRDLVLATLDERAVTAVRPAGTFYVMVDVSRARVGSAEFARRLLADERVAVVPGNAFGAGGVGMVRVSLAAAEPEIERGVDGLAAELTSLSEAA